MAKAQILGYYTLREEEYTLRSVGFMGSMHVLVATAGPAWLQNKSFLGEGDILRRDGGPITVIGFQPMLSIWFTKFKVGKPEYTMIQEGFGSVTMREGTEDDIVMRIISDGRWPVT